jgi:hypothetical protein
MRTQRRTRRLAETVVTALCGSDPSATRTTLPSFTLRDWERSYYWLDASGVALYFLEAAKAHGLHGLIPLEVVRRLEQNQADNQRRTAELFQEFVTINETFCSRGVRYVTLKGFSLTPAYCRDLSLRYQLDLDFLISPTDELKCRELIEQMGYRLNGLSNDVMEFKAGENRPPAIEMLYQPRSERGVELHLAHPPLAIDRTDELLHRSAIGLWNGYSFPVLSHGDMFLSQSFHLMRHIRSEWTRLSWLLEFKHFVTGRHDVSFWIDIRKRAEEFDGAAAVGIVTALATELFGEFAPRELWDWSVDPLPAPVRLWISRYARQTMLAEFPGTKLYLLLEQVWATDTVSRRQTRRGKLLPSRLPRKISGSDNVTRSARMRSRLIQVRYVLFRLWFHLVAGVGYALEVRGWKRALSLAEEVTPRIADEDRRAVMASSVH